MLIKKLMNKCTAKSGLFASTLYRKQDNMHVHIYLFFINICVVYRHIP